MGRGRYSAAGFGGNTAGASEAAPSLTTGFSRMAVIHALMASGRDSFTGGGVAAGGI